MEGRKERNVQEGQARAEAQIRGQARGNARGQGRALARSPVDKPHDTSVDKPPEFYESVPQRRSGAVHGSHDVQFTVHAPFSPHNSPIPKQSKVLRMKIDDTQFLSRHHCPLLYFHWANPPPCPSPSPAPMPRCFSVPNPRSPLVLHSFESNQKIPESNSVTHLV